MYTVDNMITSVRAKLREKNEKKVSDTEILDALTQAQDFCFNIVARRHPDSIAARANAVMDSSGSSFTLPENAFEQRLTRVYRKHSDYTVPLERVGYREIGDFDGRDGIPSHYAILKNKIIILPQGDATSYEYQYAFIQDLEPLVPSQGRIMSFTPGAGSNAKLVLNSIGSDLTSDTDSDFRFVNVIDGLSGLVKATLEIKCITTDTKEIEFKLTPTRSTIFGKEVSNDLPEEIEEDDYLCLISGTCVPYFRKPAYNYIIQFATTEIKRSLGMDSQAEEVALRKYEEQIEKLNSNRESSSRVYRKRSSRTHKRW